MIFILLNVFLACTANILLKQHTRESDINTFFLSFLLNSSSFAALYFCLKNYDILGFSRIYLYKKSRIFSL